MRKLVLNSALVILAFFSGAPFVEAQEVRSDTARNEPRILFGIESLDGQGPWAASLQRRNPSDSESFFHSCGGSFISPRFDPRSKKVVGWSPSNSTPEWLLTAAHCLVSEGEKIDATDLVVLGGTRDLADPGKGEFQEVDRVFVHERFDSNSLKNDIALLKLKEPIRQDIPRVRRSSVRLPSVADVSWISKPYLAVRAQGWGRTEKGYSSNLLLEVLLPMVDSDTCANAFAPSAEAIAPGMLCAGFVSGDFDSCQGDSGGPLVYRSQSQSSTPGFRAEPTLVGVVSWGIGCGNSNLFGIYSSALYYRRWAENTVVRFLTGS